MGVLHYRIDGSEVRSIAERSSRWVRVDNTELQLDDWHDDWAEFVYWIQQECLGEVTVSTWFIRFQHEEDRTKFILRWM